MLQTAESDIHALQAYTDAEFRTARDRLIENPILPDLVRTYFPNLPLSEFVKRVSSLESVSEFQTHVVSPAIELMLRKGSSGITLSGTDHLSRNGKYLFLSNHRDIICDPSLFTQQLHAHGFSTPRICLGDNLLTGALIIDLIKMNKGVTVKRKLAPRELLRWSHALSELIFRSIHEGADSVWIAQKEGRTKNGDDRTHPGVIKMLAMAGQGSFAERVSALHLVPVAVSYEYDPCDIHKAKELHMRATEGAYIKAPGEDHKSMIESIRGFKGRIHIAIGHELAEECRAVQALESKKDQLNFLTEATDRQIHRLYRLWPTNYIALDLLNHQAEFEAHYTAEQKRHFIDRMESRLEGLAPGVRLRFLEAYARPVTNNLEADFPYPIDQKQVKPRANDLN